MKKPINVLSFPSRHPYMSKFDDGTNIKFVNPNSDFFNEKKFTPDYLKFNFPPNKYDLVHIHFSFDRVPLDQFEKLLTYFHDLKKPIVWTSHSLESLRIKNYGRGKYQELLFKYSDQIISPTQGSKNTILKKYGPHKNNIQVIPLGYMTSPADVARISKQTSKSKNVFTMLIGDFRENKEVIQSIINFLQCKGLENTWLQLIYKPISLYNSNWENFASKKLIFFNLTQNPRIINLSMPSIPNDILTKAFIESHAIILPYKWGTHSGQIELAKDCGCHVVTTNVGFFKEQWSEINIWQIDDNDFDQFPNRYTNCLLDVYNKKSLKPAGKERNKELDKLIGLHTNIYQNLLTNYKKTNNDKN